MAMTIATIGPADEEAGHVSAPRVACDAGCGFTIVPSLSERGVDDDAVARLQPLLDDPAVADRARRASTVRMVTLLSGVSDADLVVRSGARSPRAAARAATSLPDRGLRADAAVLAGPQHVAGIREQRADADRARLRIDLAIDGEDGAASAGTCCRRRGRASSPPLACQSFARSMPASRPGRQSRDTPAR